jgi:hypothetical protein
MEKTNVIVVVRGGLVSAVYSDGNISVDVLDFDNLEADPDSEYENSVKAYLDEHEDFLQRAW